MEIRTFAAVLVTAAVLSGSPTAVPGSDAGSVARGLQTWLDGTRDLRGRFEQTLVSGAFGSAVPESGTLLLLRPGRMRWDYARPEPKVAVLEGDRTSVYLPEDHQMIRGRLSEEGSALHTLLVGTGRLADLFQATLVDPAPTPGAVRLRLVPRATSEAFQSVVLDLEPKTFGILGAEVLDPAGNLIRYRFSALRRNQGVPAEAFHLEPPPGTEIIDSR